MNKFELIKSPDESYDFLVIATSYENPLNDFQEIKRELSVKSAKLLFDLTLINGLKKNRYIQCDYESHKDLFKKCSVVNSVSETIKSISHTFFCQNEEIVKNSVVPKALKFLLRTGSI